jgi:hypothetical protein
MSQESYIVLPPDSTGKATRTILKTIEATNVHSEVTVPTSCRKLIGAYQYASPVIPGSTTAGYVYHAFFYPATATRLVAIRRITIFWNTVAAAVYIEAAVWRISAASGGTSRAVTDVAKKDTNYPDPTIEIRDTGVTVSVAQKLFNFLTPGAAGQTIGIVKWESIREDGRDDIILRPGQGICLRQEAVGDTDFRVNWIIEWEEFEGVPVVV